MSKSRDRDSAHSMELLLNLAWLLLAVPAFWVWRGRALSRRTSSRQALLTLGCLLTILFPVISASDDLRAMRTEMEESSTIKRSLRQASSDRSATSNLHAPVAVVCAASDFFVADEFWRTQPSFDLLSLFRFDHQKTSRAPPSLSFS